MSAEDERASIRKQFHAEFNAGAKCGFSQESPAPHEKGGYPLGFHAWRPARRNAWYCGYNKGNCDRNAKQKGAAND